MVVESEALQVGGTSPEPERERERAVLRVLLIEGSVNLMMLIAKLAVGVTVGSTVILGDALHSLADLANNGVAAAAQRISSRPPDIDHPYGHRKYEQLAVFMLAGLLVMMAFELSLHAVERFGTPVAGSRLGLAVMGAVFISNLLLAAWQNRRANELDSDLLRADARHTAGDVATTTVVIVGWQTASIGYAWADPLCAIAMAMLIVYLAFGLFRSAIPILVDHAVAEADQLTAVISKLDHVLEVRRVRSRFAGYRDAADVVVAVDDTLSSREAHAVADDIERALAQEFNIHDVSVHVEPIRITGTGTTEVKR